MTEEAPSATRALHSLAVVNWWYPDGSTVTSCPLQLPMAEAVAKAYVDRYPERRSWLTVPPPLREARRGRA
jgi:hypothetical protein